MVKVKREKKMGLIELLEYIKKQGIRSKTFYSDNTTISRYVHIYGDGDVEVEYVDINSVFIVKVEEEITEDTKLDNLVEMYNAGISVKKSISLVSKLILKNVKL